MRVASARATAGARSTITAASRAARSMAGSLATRGPERIGRMTAVMMQRVLDAIRAAVDDATHGGHGRLFVLHGRLDDALGDFPHHLGDLLVGGFDVAGARGAF